jgi:hypothetical protein
MVIAGVVVAVLGCASHRGGALMTWKEYETRSVQWPYLLRFDPPRGSLLYYGARHTYAPQDAQVEQIERLWTCFQPTMAYNEGGNPPVEKSRDSAVEKYGEAGLVRFLAARDNVPVASLDPDRAEEVAHLRQSFSDTDVKLFFVLRAVAQFADRRGPSGVDAELQRVLAILNGSPGLGVSPRSISEVAAAFTEKFPDVEGYGKSPMRWFDPMRSETFLNRVSRTGSEYRDRAIVANLTRSLADRQRVFAVVGGTHVVMQEGALSSLLGARGRRPTNSGASAAVTE